MLLNTYSIAMNWRGRRSCPNAVTVLLPFSASPSSCTTLKFTVTIPTVLYRTVQYCIDIKYS